MTKVYLKKFLALLLVCAFLFSLASQGVSAEDAADALRRKIEENQKKIEQLHDQQAAQSEIVDALKEQDNDYQRQLDALNAEVDGYSAKIDAKSAEIDKLEKDILSLEKEVDKINKDIENMNVEIEKTYDLLGERLRAMYMAGNTSEIEVLLTAGDFSEFLTRSELLRRVSKHDTDLVSGLKDEIKELDKKAEELEEKKVKIQEEKQKLDDEKYELTIARAEIQEKLDEVQKTADAIEAQRKANAKKLQDLVDMEEYYEKQNEEYANTIDALARQASQGSGTASGENFTNDSGFPVSGSGFICPLQYPGTYVSAGYGTYPSGRTGHTGTDYCVSGGTMGKNVRAIAGGTVILAKYQSNSYGNHIMIDHGNGITSLYAHASSLLVSVGQHVNQGDIIMLAGSTGNSTGAHVHLEIRINGNRVNPANYIVLP
ncbi:MAG: peptidoglycan DD-metalloendopeptidase family protein [Clostridia bacterium]|nr:peptidoglycan DD-metalloendopeptidase family protein [Clostridia bacterium]